MSEPILKHKQPFRSFKASRLESVTVEKIAAMLSLDLPTAAKILQLLRSYQGNHNGNSLIIGGPTGWQWKPTLASDPQDHHGNFSGFPGIHHSHGQLSDVGPDNHHPRIHSTGDAFPVVADPGDLFYHLILKTLSVNQGV